MKIFERFTNKFWRIISLPKVLIKINSIHFKVPRLLLNDFNKSSYVSEKWLTTLLNKLNNTNSINVFFDVGVNIGQTLLKIKSVNQNVHYVGFEPNPFCCAIVENIVATNSLKNCHIIPCGLGDNNEIMKLKLSNNDLMDSSASLVPDFRESKSTDRFQFVSVNKLDDILNQIDSETIDIVKIDVEGGELEAIKGMKNTIIQYNPILILEVLPSYSEDNEFRISRQNELATILKELEYSIYQLIDKDIGLRLKLMEEFPVHGNVEESDYILIPSNREIKKLGLPLIN